MGTFEIKDKYYLNGEEFKLISGAIHYFRVVPEYWHDRLLKLRAMGANTVETIIPWNVHEKEKGVFDFSGMRDIKAFVKTAEEVGLHVILRPSPYICGEWEFGGFPAWLLKEDGMRFRCMYEPWLKEVREYYDTLMPYLMPLMINEGGPVIMMQIENEYGYYGDDHEYMKWLHDTIRGYGITVPLFTSDGPYDESFKAGMVDGVLETGNFGSKGEERFAFMKKYVDGPLTCMEFWPGWFDGWGDEVHHTTKAEENAKDFGYMIEHGNVNIYMFIGGTNFGFMSGANYYDKLSPDVTSYDYDAILSEDGRITKKYELFKEEIKKRFGLPEVTNPHNIKRKAYGSMKQDGFISLWEALPEIGKVTHSKYPVSMEKVDQGYGYILYHSKLNEIEELKEIRLMDCADRANVFVDHENVITLYDTELLSAHKLEKIVPALGKDLDILVENMGRVNFGPFMNKQRKGIDGHVILNTRIHFDYDIISLPLENTDKLKFVGYDEGKVKGPGFHHFNLNVDEPCDTFVDMHGWGKGCVFINGFNLGRFWDIGPQMTLYIPAPLLKKGSNDVIVFETEGKSEKELSFTDTPDIGKIGVVG